MPSGENAVATASAQSPVRHLVVYFNFGIHAQQTVIRDTEQIFENVTETFKVGAPWPRKIRQEQFYSKQHV